MADASALGQFWHLTRRFAGSLKPGPPAPADEAWAVEHLGPGERDLWVRMSNPDRRHAVGVAREVARRWPEFIDDGPAAVPREVVAAGLLHDVGKIEAGLGTPARVAATLVWAVLDDDVARRWADRAGPVRSRLGRYRRHPAIGADLLRAAGADPLTASWAEEHHRAAATWTVPNEVGQLLKACDDD